MGVNGMTEATLAKLERMKNRATSYEVVATDGARSVLVGYTRKTQDGIRDLLMGWLDERSGTRRLHMVAVLTGTESGEWEFTRRDGASCGAWSVKFTGRTRRAAVIEGELADSIYL